MLGSETILLIVLGFALASLIALFAGRLVWTAAVKAGARRMQRQVPSSLAGLQTERDRLRAEYAMLAQRMGARLEEANLKLAEAMAEVSRHRNRMRLAENGQAELRDLHARVRELELALADARAIEAGLRQALAAKEDAVRKLRKKSGYGGQLFNEPAAAAEDPELRLRQRIDKLSQLARAARPEEAASPIAHRLAEAERQTLDLEAGLRKLEAGWSTPDSSSGDIIQLPNRPRGHTTATT
jgi:hypothetical protein